MQNTAEPIAPGRNHTEFPSFSPRAPWIGGDLQTLRNVVLRPDIDLSPWPGRRIWVPMPDGSGDRLAVMLHRPTASTSSSPANAGATAERSLVVLIHGLTGCEDSFYIRRSAAEFLRRGYSVARINLRGAGPSRRRSRYQYHAGRSEDLHHLLTGLCQQVPGVSETGLVMTGYSLGGNLLIKYLSEDWSHPAKVVAAVSISAPIDLWAAQQRIMQPRNRFYHAYLLNRMKFESRAGAAELSQAERRAIRKAQSVFEFDDLFVAPRNGFRDANDYYSCCSGASRLASVRTPLLVVAATDDPWIPVDCYHRVDWSANPRLTPLIAVGGGHLGFHSKDSSIPWHDRCMARFLDSLGV